MTSDIPLGKVLAIAALMLGAALVTLAITPRPGESGPGQAVDLEAMFPRKFGSWRSSDEALPAVVGDAARADAAARIYAQVLYRTYSNSEGDQILLTVAYGGQQTDSLAMHRPEVCYAAQGFRVTPVHGRTLTIGGRKLPVKILAAQLGARFEPITYWFVIGDQVATGLLQQKLARLRYALVGRIPDGMLIRVSSIEPDSAAAFARQARFIGELFDALDRDARRRLLGADLMDAAGADAG